MFGHGGTGTSISRSRSISNSHSSSFLFTVILPLDGFAGVQSPRRVVTVTVVVPGIISGQSGGVSCGGHIGAGHS